MNMIETFVRRLAPLPVCDHCLSDRVGISGDVAAKIGSAVSHTRLYRGKGCCGLCGLSWLVTRATSA